MDFRLVQAPEGLRVRISRGAFKGGEAIIAKAALKVTSQEAATETIPHSRYADGKAEITASEEAFLLPWADDACE